MHESDKLVNMRSLPEQVDDFKPLRDFPPSSFLPSKDLQYFPDAQGLVAWLQSHDGYLSERSLLSYREHVVTDRGGKGWKLSTAAKKIRGAKACIKLFLEKESHISELEMYRIKDALQNILTAPTVKQKEISGESIITEAEEKDILSCLEKDG